MVGAPGLGSEVWQALQKLNIGRALEGGLCIVFMAILLDRLLSAAAVSAKPVRANWWRAGIAQPSARIRVLFAGILVIILLDYVLRSAGLLINFPKALEVNIRGAINEFVSWFVNLPAIYQTTEIMTYLIYVSLLNPLQSALLALPFWAFTAAMFVIAAMLGGWRLALLAASTCLVFGITGLWEPSMQTLASVAVSVLFCATLGIPLAIWSGRNVRVEQALRPILDTMQTMPAFVYLVPVIMLFGANIVSALIATVVYALPPLVRIGAMGFREIPAKSTKR